MYIRTKDGKVYNLESKEVSSWEYIDNDTAINEYGVDGAFYTIYYFDENKGHYSEYDDKGGHSCDFIEEKDILKQSDNLAELCDEVVLIDGKHKKPKWLLDKPKDIANFNELDTIHKNRINKGTFIFMFGIWTDKGLIYVAKMNSEGELVVI